jgi:ADP-ribosyl-[dinitrogen reductase] hydrolase
VYQKSLFMCRLPGSRGKPLQPDTNPRLAEEVKRMKETGIRAVVCLVSKEEAKGEGVVLKDYRDECAANGVEFFHYAIKSMKAPADSPAVLLEALLSPVLKLVRDGEGVAVHCKNGVGRAGTIAACLLLCLGFEDRQVDKIVKHLRAVRSPNCLQSAEQEAYVKAFSKHLAAVPKENDHLRATLD